MSNFNDCVVIEALAGAGKTFKLSHRYLELIQMGADPKSILATTFSRKAAGEIRDKIIEQTAEAVLKEKNRRNGGRNRKKVEGQVRKRELKSVRPTL